MKYSRTVKTISVIGLAIALLCVTVAYAVLSTNLSITGSGSVENAGWDIHFANVSNTSSGTAICENPKIDDSTKTTLSDFSVVLKNPSDSCIFTFDVINDGGIDAIINSISTPSTTNGMECTGLSSVTGTDDGKKLCNNLNMELTYTNDKSGTVKTSDSLPKKTTHHMSLKFSLKSTSSNVPVDDVKVSGLNFSIVYIQTT